MAKFGKDNPPTGRPKGSVDRFTAFRRQLADLLPEARAALVDGVKAADHAAALLDVLERTNRLETAVALADATLVKTSPLETAQAVIDTARQHGALDTVMEATRTALPYLVPHPQPEPPPATGIVSAEPIGLDGEDWEKEYSNPYTKEDGLHG